MKRSLKPFVQGVVFGGALVAAFAVGYAYANQEKMPSNPQIEAGNCSVRVGYGRITTGDRCFMDEVMVGTRGDYLLCADVTVNCQ